MQLRLSPWMNVAWIVDENKCSAIDSRRVVVVEGECHLSANGSLLCSVRVTGWHWQRGKEGRKERGADGGLIETIGGWMDGCDFHSSW